MILYLTRPVFKCGQWSTWMSVSVPSQGDEQELLADLEETYPEMCRERGKIQCRVQGSEYQAKLEVL